MNSVAAAVDVLWLATLPPGTTEPYGELVQHRRVLREQPRRSVNQAPIRSCRLVA
jgi:hypothetical protein